MSEDVVDFGEVERIRQAPRLETIGRVWKAPALPAGRQTMVLPLAVAGAALGVASLFGPWQRVAPGGVVPQEVTQTYLVSLATLGTFGVVYLITLIGTVAAFTLGFYGNPGVREPARLIGLVLAGSCMVIVAAITVSLSEGTGLGGAFIIVDEDEQERWKFILEWGVWAAFGASVALTGALAWLSTKPAGSATTPPASGGEAGAAGEPPADGMIDLSVSVHPIGKQVASG